MGRPAYNAAMFVSVTRLRIRSIRFLPMFMIAALRTSGQSKRAAGLIGGELLVDRRMTFWTMTTWLDKAAMIAYRNSGIHHAVMPRLINWCDEAAVVNWSSEIEKLPDWGEAYAMLKADGSLTKVRHPSTDHVSRIFAEPRLTIRRKLAVISDSK